jgi:hypothetical protein
MAAEIVGNIQAKGSQLRMLPIRSSRWKFVPLAKAANKALNGQIKKRPD